VDLGWRYHNLRVFRKISCLLASQQYTLEFDLKFGQPLEAANSELDSASTTGNKKFDQKIRPKNLTNNLNDYGKTTSINRGAAKSITADCSAWANGQAG
jgi:hypothetical protein